MGLLEKALTMCINQPTRRLLEAVKEQPPR